jgi:anti-sigma factor RsiW
MTGMSEDRAGQELWRRFAAEPVEPDFLALAAYAEGRLAGPERDAVEAWLELNPEIATDLGPAEPAAVTEAAAAAVARRAMALVAAPAGNVVLFQQRPVRRWVEWAAMAATLVAIVYGGFTAGSDVSASLVSTDTAQADTGDLFDPPTGFFAIFNDSSST